MQVHCPACAIRRSLLTLMACRGFSTGGETRRRVHALRHAPYLYELELDDEGWVSVAALLTALRNDREEWLNITTGDLVAITEQLDKRRFEIRGGKIRALYGHSVLAVVCGFGLATPDQAETSNIS